MDTNTVMLRTPVRVGRRMVAAAANQLLPVGTRPLDPATRWMGWACRDVAADLVIV